MSYVGIDTQGARALAKVLQDTAGQVEGIRRSVFVALNLADVASQVPAQLAMAQDGFTRLSAGVNDKAALAEQFVMDPQATAAGLGAPADVLGVALSGLLGFAGPTDLRAVLVGLPAPGADPALDGALARLNPVLLPAFQAGQRPVLNEAQLADLRRLALALGIEHAGPPVTPIVMPDVGNGMFAGLFAELGARLNARTGTEVFWNDFWAGGRTVDGVLADPALLLEWVAGTFELDRRLALATQLPTLGDVLASVDFATRSSDPAGLAAMLAAAETEFAAISGWLPAFLVGQDRTAPDATQLAQTLAFAARVGWPDPGAVGDQARFDSAIAFLRANRALQSALLPTGFEGDPDPLAFFNGPGIGFLLDMGQRTGVLNDTVAAGIAATVDQALAAFGVDLSGPAPVVLTEQLQQQLFALLSTQIPRSALETPAIQAQFIAALGFLRAAGTGPEQRQRLIEVLAAFRTLTTVGAPALTERQLVAAVGGQVLDVLGRSRLRLRSQEAVRKNPEFLLVARQWGLPGGRKEEIGKYKFSWSFDDLGVLTSIRRKKKSWLSRAWDTVKAVGKAIWDSWEDNPLKAIFQVGKIALGALAFVVPGFQALGAAAFAVNIAETAFHAIEGDWLAAIGSGLAAFTAGATDVFNAGALPTIVETAQNGFVSGILDASTLSFLKDAKRAFDIGSSIFRFTQADSLAGAIGAGLGAVSTTLGSGGQLLRSLNLADEALVRDLTQLGLSVADMNRLVAPAAGLANGGSVLASLGNGLALLAAGARVLTNPLGAFASPQPVAGAIVQFDPQTLNTLRTISQGAGAAAGVARAIDAANRGDTFLTGAFLAQAIQAINDPRTSVIGGRVQAAERVAEIGVLLEAVFERRASPSAVAPLVVQRLTSVFDALNTPQPRPVASTASSRSGTTTPAATQNLNPVPGIILTPGTLNPGSVSPGSLTPGLLSPGLLSPGLLSPGSLLPGSMSTFGQAEAFVTLGQTGGASDADVSEVRPAPFPGMMRLGGPRETTESTTAGSILTGFTLSGDVQHLTGSGLASLGAVNGEDATDGMVLAQALTPSPQFVPRPRVSIAVIGNSYTSGEGADIDTYERTEVDVGGMTLSTIHPAHRSSQAAAMQVIERLRAQHPDVDFDIRFVAVTGATPDEIRYVRPHAGTPFETVPQVYAAGAQTNIRAGEFVSMADIVILGEGGNPHFRNVADTVLGWGNSYTPEVNAELLNRVTDGTFRRTQSEIQEDVLSRMNPNGTLIVVGYPKILPDVMPGWTELYNPFASTWAPYTGTVLYTAEAQMVNSFTFSLNWETELATSAHMGRWGNRAIHFVNPWGAFEGHDILSANPAAHGADINPATGTMRSFHPTAFGYGLLADFYQPFISQAVQRAIDQQRPPAPPDVPHRRGDADIDSGEPVIRHASAEDFIVPAGITLVRGDELGIESYMGNDWTPYLTGNLASLDTTSMLTANLASFDAANLGVTDFLGGGAAETFLAGGVDYAADWSNTDWSNTDWSNTDWSNMDYYQYT